MSEAKEEKPVSGELPAAPKVEPASMRQRPSGVQELGTAALSILLYLLLLDAAVETFLSGAPVRWFVAGAVAGYVALSVLLWRRFSWSAKAAVSLLILLGLLALTTWLPEGISQGVVVLRQPTPNVLAAVSILAILLSSVILVRLTFVPVQAKVAMGILGAYGVAAFALGIASGTGYSALFHGRSLWERLPFWLQGAFVGTLVLVPAALLVRISYGLRKIRGRRLHVWALQSLSLAMSVAMAIGGFAERGGPQRLAAESSTTAGPNLSLPSSSDVGSARTSTLESPKIQVLSIDQAVARTEHTLGTLSLEDYVVAAQAKALGGGVGPAFEFVRDRIRYEAYSGVLRGADGTYTARAGNAADRALLLAKILQLNGVQIRFVLGRLPQSRAEDLFARMFQSPTKSQPAASPAAGGSESEDFLARLRARALRDYSAIKAALGNRLPSPAVPSREDVLAEIEEHVWIQANVDGRWVDLDPSFADAAPGQVYATPDQTLKSLPHDLNQRVTVRVIAELLADGSLASETLLETTMPAAELLDREIFIVHTSGRRELTGGGSPGGDAWAPTLWIDGELVQGRPVSFSEEGASPGGIGGVFGGAFSTPPILVAEWLEFEIAWPGGRREVTRRALMDRANAAWRARSAHDANGLRHLPRDAHGALPPQAIHNIWFSAGPHDLSAYAGALWVLAHALAAAPPQTSGDQTFGDQAWPVAVKNFAFSIWSDHVIIPSLNDASSYRFYADSPRILIFSNGPQEDGSFFAQSDLRRDHIRGVARDPSAVKAVVDRKIWFGVLEGALEHEMMTRAMAAPDAPSPQVVSTSSFLTSEGAVALEPGDDSKLEQLTPNQGLSARLGVVLRSGHAVIIPRGALAHGRAAWWEITQADADTIAVVDDLNSSYSRGPVGGGRGTTFGDPWARGGSQWRDVVDEETGEIIGRYNTQTGQNVRFRSLQAHTRKKKGGNEYLILLTVISVATIAALTGYVIYKQILFHQATIALEAAIEANEEKLRELRGGGRK